MELKKAKEIANKVTEKLKIHCDRIAVAGSVRRQCDFVNDIEVVCIPKKHATKLCHSNGFCMAVYQLGKILMGGKKGLHNSKMIKINLIEGIKLDLFIATEKNWANILLIRTGSAMFSHAVLREFNRKNCFSRNGVIQKQGKGPIYFKEEKEIFKYLGFDWIPPEKRNGGLPKP